MGGEDAFTTFARYGLLCTCGGAADAEYGRLLMDSLGFRRGLDLRVTKIFSVLLAFSVTPLMATYLKSGRGLSTEARFDSQLSNDALEANARG